MAETNALHVVTNVSIVPMLLITVLNVSHQESWLHPVTVQMVSSTTVTLVLVVLITVILVKPEMNV